MSGDLNSRTVLGSDNVKDVLSELMADREMQETLAPLKLHPLK